MIAAGDQAPDFEAVDQDGAPFRLSSLRGAPVVLYFYPAADTPGCTNEAKGFRDRHGEFRARGVHVIGVSPDDCPAQKAFADKYGLPFRLLADRSRSIAQTFGVLSPKNAVRRVSFLLDENGRVLEVVSGGPEHHVERAGSRFLSS